MEESAEFAEVTLDDSDLIKMATMTALSSARDTFLHRATSPPLLFAHASVLAKLYRPVQGRYRRDRGTGG